MVGDEHLAGLPVPVSTTVEHTPLTPDQQRVRDRCIETLVGWPTSHSMIFQLREALGLFAGAMPITPMQAWEEALAEVRRLRERAGG